MDLKQRVLDIINADKKGIIDFANLGNTFAETKVGTKELLAVLYELIKDGTLVFSSFKKACLPEKLGYIKGKVSMHPKGFGFLEREDNSLADLFISPKDLNGALNGDIVFVKVKNDAKFLNGKSDEVSIAQIIERANNNIVGVYQKNKDFGFVVPDDKRYPDVYIKNDKTLKVSDKDKVVCNVTGNRDNRNFSGKITEVLGKVGDKGIDILSVIRAYKLYEEFPQEVLFEAGEMPKFVDAKRYAKRKSFIDKNVITIDGEDAKDIDDAISITKEGTNFRLFVHIADVTEYVKHESKLDLEAYNRGTSVYFPDRVLPMLPRELSNGICSLNEGEIRLALTCEILFDKLGHVVGGDVYESIITSNHRMTYSSVTKIFNGDNEEIAKYQDVYEDLLAMNELSELLIKLRVKRGAIDFDIPEAYIKVDEKGKTVAIEKRPRDESDKLIESFMLAANEFVAEKFFKLEVPFVYRVHEKPDEMRVATFVEFCGGFGEIFKIKNELTGLQLQAFLNLIEGKPYENIVNKIALRTMQKAKYSELCMGHFGLAAQYYCHFTAPIRRYPDLTIHRIIKWYLSGEFRNKDSERIHEFVVDSANQSSIRERLAEQAERDVDDMKKAEYMEQFIGNEFEGVISSVTNFGLFIELPNTVEGLVRIESLPATENYTYVEKKFMFQGKTKTLKLGDNVKVKLENASASSKKIDFSIIF